MDETTIRAAVETERLGLCRHLEGLAKEDWSTPSLCKEWTVKEVVAHLTTTTRTRPLTMVGRIVRARGSFHRMSSQVARELAARQPTSELIEQLRETAGSARRMPGSGAMDPLVDVLVHGQDIARPLGLAHKPPSGVVTAALDYVVDNRFYGNPARVAGTRLLATDVDWSSGHGDETRGRAIDLLLVTTGRAAGLDGLSGAGAALLSSRLS